MMKNQKEIQQYVSEKKNWSDLHADPLMSTAERTSHVEDFLNFREVCVSWKSAANEANLHGNCRYPWLILRTRSDGVDSTKLVNPFNGNAYFWKTVSSESYAVGIKGWLLNVADDGSMSLLHAFSGTQIDLPHKNNLIISNRDEVHEAALSSCPLTSSSYVLAIQVRHHNLNGGTMGLWRSGNEFFTKFRDLKGYYSNITFCNGSLYATKDKNFIVEFDFGKKSVSTRILDSHALHQLNCGFYLVECGGELLAVFDILSVCFRVYKFHANLWMMIDDIGNKALILSKESTPLSMDLIDRTSECKPNHIYFVSRSVSDSNMFLYSYSLKDRKIEQRKSIQLEGSCTGLPKFF